MENMDTDTSRARIKLEKFNELFSSWHEQVESLCHKAVFAQDEALMDVLIPNLAQKRKAIEQMVQRLVHEKESKAQALQPKTSSNNRMAASLPGLNTKYPAAIFIPIDENSKNGQADNLLHAMEEIQLSSQKKSETSATIDYSMAAKKNTLSSLQATKIPSKETDDEISAQGSEDGPIQEKKIFLTNLARETTSKTVAEYFKRYGSVVDVKIFRFQNGESRGFGAVEFVYDASVGKAIKGNKHMIDGRDVEASPFRLRVGTAPQRGGRRFQIFLGGVPTFLSKAEVEDAIRTRVKVRELKLNSERGYAYLDLEDDNEAQMLLNTGYINIGAKKVECKKNLRQ